MPTNFDWGNINGTNYLTIPQYCGSCWAQSATSAMSDRIKIIRNSSWPDFNLAPQVLISCFDICQGCHGGLPILVYEYLTTNYITDETCSPYQAWGQDDGLPCSSEIICQNEQFYFYQVSEYGYVQGEQAMMSEIYQRGPITCGVSVPESLENYTGGILYDHTNNTDITHDISVVGWGVENGTKYWRVRNSWGTPWGEQGYFRIIRGVNNIEIESNCSWAVMMDTWTHDQMKNRNGTTTSKTQNNHNIQEQIEKQSYISYPQSGNTPSSWDWRKMVINCNGGGNCSGGSSLGVYKLAYQMGIPDFSCQVYYGGNAQVLPVCSAKDICYTCDWPPSPLSMGIGAGNCDTISNYKKYYVSSYGNVNGIENIKKEVYQRGPISCSIAATQQFLNWTGFGIYSENNTQTSNFYVSIVGYGTENGQNYWIVRNSLGTFWGYYDFFRIKMESQNLGITENCSYGVPSFTANAILEE